MIEPAIYGTEVDPYGPDDPTQFFGLIGHLAPGVNGYQVVTPRANYIPMLMATEEGHGDVGRFLDGLDRTQTWKIPCIISGRLIGMLERRGWRPTREYTARHDEWVDVWVLDPKGE